MIEVEGIMAIRGFGRLAVTGTMEYRRPGPLVTRDDTEPAWADGRLTIDINGLLSLIPPGSIAELDLRQTEKDETYRFSAIVTDGKLNAVNSDYTVGFMSKGKIEIRDEKERCQAVIHV